MGHASGVCDHCQDLITGIMLPRQGMVVLLLEPAWINTILMQY
jgi:hypothetical protein